uniref:Uncharacterized protein n=1 Tax=Oryza rufipogon TaxID=4529 RepID=A0A0E0PDR5_ORYRU
MAQPRTHVVGGLRALRTAIVSPSPAPPAGERALPLTFLDAQWLSAHPVERVFFYRLGPGGDDVDAVLSRLVDAPRLLPARRPRPPHARRDQPPGDGVAFTVAEHDGVGVGVDELADTDEPREVARIATFVPELPKGGAVLALQATVLPPDRRGLALGVTVHHSACDGVSSTHFLHTWAAACAGDRVLPEPPVIDRTIIRDRNDMYDAFASPASEAKHAFDSPDVAGKLLATFTLSRQQLQNVKDAVAGEAARRGVAPPRCTSLVATLGLTWLCFRRAGPDGEEGPRGDGRAHLVFPVDHRSRLEPRVPEKYLGNCIGPGFATAHETELATTTTTADGLFTACAAVAAGIDEAVRGEPTYWERWVERITEACADDMSLSVAGSTRFGVYDMDFGFGRPAKVDVVSVAKTDAMSVAEDRSGSGGIEVGIALSPARMERFRRWLADAIALLSSVGPSPTITEGLLTACTADRCRRRHRRGFGVYDVDFGFGRAAKVDVVSVEKTDAMSVAEDRFGSGGIEMGIALPSERSAWRGSGGGSPTTLPGSSSSQHN